MTLSQYVNNANSADTWMMQCTNEGKTSSTNLHSGDTITIQVEAREITIYLKYRTHLINIYANLYKPLHTRFVKKLIMFMRCYVLGMAVNGYAIIYQHINVEHMYGHTLYSYQCPPQPLSCNAQLPSRYNTRSSFISEYIHI